MKLLAYADRDTWIFDVDYTLYGPEAALFEQVVPRITEFVATHLNLDADRAREVQRQYYQTYGSTLAGMVRHHGVDPHVFSDFVHHIDYSVLKPSKSLKEKIAALPGRKLIFTNATMKHAGQVLEGLGLSFDDFDHSFDVEMADWTPKPDVLPYERLMQQFDVAADKAVFFEDTPKNLKTAQQLGWGTVWIKAGDDPRNQGQSFAADLEVPAIEQALDLILEG